MGMSGVEVRVGREYNNTDDDDRKRIGGTRENRSQLVLACAMLGRLTRQIHLDEQLDAAARRLRGPVQPREQIGGVDRMADVQAGGFSGFVGLEMPDQMPTAVP